MIPGHRGRWGKRVSILFKPSGCESCWHATSDITTLTGMTLFGLFLPRSLSPASQVEILCDMLPNACLCRFFWMRTRSEGDDEPIALWRTRHPDGQTDPCLCVNALNAAASTIPLVCTTQRLAMAGCATQFLTHWEPPELLGVHLSPQEASTA